MTGVLAALIGSIARGWSWVMATINTTGVYRAAIYADISTNAKYFAFRNASSVFSYSADGVTWTSGNFPGSTEPGGVAFNGTTLVVTRTDGARVFTSTNGTTWTSRSIADGLGSNTSDVIWDGTRFLLGLEGDTDSGGLIASTDGTTWGKDFDIGPNQVRTLAYDGTSRYIALSYTAATTAATTTGNPTVAANWSNVTLPSSQLWKRVIFGNGIWLAFRTATTAYATSTDGTTWTARTLPAAFGRVDLNSDFSRPLFHDGKFYYVTGIDSGTTGAGALYSSADGINWTVEHTFAASNLDGVADWAVGPNQIIGVGFNYASGATSPGNTNAILRGTK